MAKTAVDKPIQKYVPTPECVAMREDIARYYAGVIPQMRRAFAEYVFKQGSGAMAPTVRDGKQESWQAVGRRLYGAEFVNDMRAVIEEHSVVSEQ